MHMSRRCLWASTGRPREFGMPWLWLIGCCLLPWGERPALADQPSQSEASLPSPEIVWRETGDPDATRVFEVVGLGRPLLEALQRAHLSTAEWSRLFAVYAGVSSAEVPSDLPAMLGRHRIVGDRLRFQPRYRVETDVSYVAVLSLRNLPKTVSSSLPSTSAHLRQGDRVVGEYLLRSARKQRATLLTEVYPTSDALPENLLKLYLHFSAPMSRGESYRHIRLVHESGRLVDLPF